MPQDSQLDQLITATDAWYGGVPVPADFDPAPGETVYAVVPGVELVELRECEPALHSGSSAFSHADTAAMASLPTGVARTVQLTESVPARDRGTAVITGSRLVFQGKRRREWRFSELVGLTHDDAVPETWLGVESRKRVSGLRYPGTAAVQLRFSLALALATARGERPALRAALAAQRPVEACEPTGPVTPPLSVAPAPPSWVGRAGRGLGLVYLGKRGMPVPLRVAQGAAAALLTLGVLVVAVGPDTAPRTAELSAASQAGTHRVDESAQQAADAKKAVDDQAARDREAARLAAEKTTADKVAAEQAETAKAATAKAAADKAAADKAAADQAAAAQAAAAQASAAKAAADAAARTSAQAAADRAAAQTAAAAPPQAAGSGCESAYPDFCIPVGPDLDCRDISQKRFTVLAPDPYRFDADHDGVGCES